MEKQFLKFGQTNREVSNLSTRKMEEINAIPKQCIHELLSLRDSFDALSSKWSLPILQYLYNRQQEDNSFSNMAGEIPGISEKMLAKQLRELESNLLIAKNDHEGILTRMVYQITEHGKSTIPLIRKLVEWGKVHREVIKNAI